MLKQFIGKNQNRALTCCMKSEEKQYFVDMVSTWSQTIQTMPKTYETDGQGKNAKEFVLAVLTRHELRTGEDLSALKESMEEAVDDG